MLKVITLVTMPGVEEGGVAGVAEGPIGTNAVAVGMGTILSATHTVASVALISPIQGLYLL